MLLCSHINVTEYLLYFLKYIFGVISFSKMMNSSKYVQFCKKNLSKERYYNIKNYLYLVSRNYQQKIESGAASQMQRRPSCS
jgi:hypothetical protein